ncbi:MAG: sulfate ABC transporter permease subunit CysT [Bacillota bacterium]|jgi:sulfate transport system permease protein
MQRNASMLPGFNLTLGYTLSYLGLILVLPLATLFCGPLDLGWDGFWSAVTTARTLAAFRLSLGAAGCGAALNAVFGLLVAWVLVRYEFPGQRFIDALVDLPFAMPTAVAGISLTSIYAGNGWLGRFLEPLGLKVAFAPLGIVVALTFIGLPFVVRSLQPVLLDLDWEVEEAAAGLGANRWQTFWRIIFPALLPSWLSGVASAFARGLGEYGSVVFISGNMPFKTEIVPLLIVTKLEQFDYAGAMAIAVMMLAISFTILLGVNLLQYWSRKS